jgi:hypothetical protein
MRALHINGVVLVGEPVDERVSELILRDEGASRRAAEDDDVEPADMVGDEQGVRARPIPIEASPCTEDPADARKEAWGPG